MINQWRFENCPKIRAEGRSNLFFKDFLYFGTILHKVDLAMFSKYVSVRRL